MKQVVIHGFTVQNVMFVPIPDYNFTVDIPECYLDLPLMTERLNLARAHNYMINADYDVNSFSSSVVHENPEYILFQMQDYLPWSGLNEALYGGFFIKGTEKWNHYYIPRGEFPQLGHLGNLKGIVITGGVYSSFDETLPWLEELMQFLRNIIDNFPQVKIVGICLGHQILGRVFGGQTSKNPCRTYIFKQEELKSHQEFENLPNTICLMECHGDCVSVLSDSGTLLYTSDSCAHEIIRYRDRAITSQGHPEFTTHFVINFYSKMLRNKGAIDESTERLALETCLRAKTDSNSVIDAFNSFLRN